MTWMNEWDVKTALDRFITNPDTPNLATGAYALQRLVEWTNSNSDGWPYWPLPSRASKSLQAALTEATSTYYRGGKVPDLTEAELARLLRPIKTFLTQQGANADEVVS